MEIERILRKDLIKTKVYFNELIEWQWFYQWNGLTGERATYGQMLTMSLRWANELKKKMFECPDKDHVVLLLLPPCADYIAACMGSIAIGVAICPFRHDCSLGNDWFSNAILMTLNKLHLEFLAPTLENLKPSVILTEKKSSDLVLQEIYITRKAKLQSIGI